MQNRKFGPGKLKFKDNGKPKQVVKKKQQPQIQQIFQQQLKLKDKIVHYEPREGTGTIVTSNRSISGEDTQFKTQITKGDHIVLQHPISKKVQERTVVLVLSDKSILIDEPFTDQCTSFSKYVIKKQDKIQKGVDLNEQYQQKLQQIHRTKPIAKPVMDVRVKKGTWSYEKKKVEISDNMTKEELLNIRQKMGKDKFCW